MPEQPVTLTRMRVTYGKTGALRFIGNLDMTRVWERTLRRSRLPLAYSQGFNPRPRFQVASSLPLGASSRCEVLDVWMENPPALNEVRAALTASAPPGLEIVNVCAVSLRQPALQTLMRASEFVITLKNLPEGYHLPAAVAALLDAPELPRERRGKAYDLRALVEHTAVIEPTPEGRPRLLARLAAREGATGRPEELLAALGLDPLDATLERVALHYEGGDPLPEGV